MDDAALLWFFIAAAAGMLGWWFGRRAGRLERPPLSRDYQLGLDHLLSGRFDAALRTLDGVASRDADALELQFAVGSLFRKRGEVDRATGLHEQLLGHPAEAVRRKAQFELALDYLAAGLFDRAEQRLTQLAAAGPYREAAQLQLLRLFEMQSDWLSALRLHQELPATLQRSRTFIAAHYLCELADQALLTGELQRAGELLDEAARYHADAARVALLRARLAERTGRAGDASEFRLRAGALQPALLSRVDAAHISFLCQECGFESTSFVWRCPRCFSWERFANRS